jgi:uncharacterized protein
MNPTIAEKPSLIKIILKVVLLLSSIQVIRLFLYRLAALAGSASGIYPPYDDITNGLSILWTVLIRWALFRPSLPVVGLTGFDASSKTKVKEIISTIIFLVLAGINLVLNPDQTIPTIISCLVFPLFEEPLFRGWIWNQVSPALPAKKNGLLTTVLVAALFAVWHLGYWDVVSFHMKVGTTTAAIVHIMLMKMVIAAIIGIFTGIFRWKTGNINASILFHAAWNLFGR